MAHGGCSNSAPTPLAPKSNEIVVSTGPPYLQLETNQHARCPQKPAYLQFCTTNLRINCIKKKRLTDENEDKAKGEKGWLGKACQMAAAIRLEDNSEMPQARTTEASSIHTFTPSTSSFHK